MDEKEIYIEKKRFFFKAPSVKCKQTKIII